MGGDKPTVRQMTDAAETPDKSDDNVFRNALDNMDHKQVRQAMDEMVQMNRDDHAVNPNIPELSIKYEDKDSTKAEALNLKTERGFMDPRKWFGDKFETNEVYRPPDETMVGKFREAISSAVLKLTGFDKINAALENAGK